MSLTGGSRFCTEEATKALPAVDAHIRRRLRALGSFALFTRPFLRHIGGIPGTIYQPSHPAPGRASRFTWCASSDDNGLLGAAEPIDLPFELGDLLLSLGQGTRRIRDPIDLGHPAFRCRPGI
jgi:hypothetical protein